MLTAPSLARVDPHDPSTDFWRFTPNGLAELLHRLGMPASVAGYGNVLACVASLWGAVGRGAQRRGAGRRRPALFPGRLRARREGEVTRPPVVDQRASAARARLPAAIGWLTVAPPAVSAAARVARLDESSTLLILADGLTALLVPPALLALGIGLQQRNRALTLLSAATASVLLWTTIPAVGLPDRVPPPAGTSPALRLFNANLHAANPDVAPIAEEIGPSPPTSWPCRRLITTPPRGCCGPACWSASRTG